MGMSDYEKQSRPVAHICNLLDAAACLAGVPLLAMVAVRDINGEINPTAWEKEYGAARLAILDRSRSHSFSDADFDAIGRALSDLKPLGDQAAWKLVDRTYGDLQYRRLIGDYSDPLYDALNDLGTDDPARVLYTGYSYLRDPQVRSAVLQRAAGKCEYCGEKSFLKVDGSRYLETHHVIALANQGVDKVTNVIALCPNDHRKAHFSAERDSIEQEMLSRLMTLGQSIRSPCFTKGEVHFARRGPTEPSESFVSVSVPFSESAESSSP
jgi:hypothetical protein